MNIWNLFDYAHFIVVYILHGTYVELSVRSTDVNKAAFWKHYLPINYQHFILFFACGEDGRKSDFIYLLFFVVVVVIWFNVFWGHTVKMRDDRINHSHLAIFSFHLFGAALFICMQITHTHTHSINNSITNQTWFLFSWLANNLNAFQATFH